MSTPIRFDYRLHLLRAARGFLSRMPPARVRAQRAIDTCPHPEGYTVEDMVWGSVISELGDSVFQNDSNYLEELTQFLDGTSGSIRRGYIHYDLRPQMKPYEYAQYQGLVELLEFLDRFPFSDVAQALAEYDQLRQGMVTQRTGTRSDGSRQDGAEPIHDLILREVLTVALNVDIRKSMFIVKHLTPATPLVSVQTYRRPPLYPDATGSLEWARRALRAIAGQDWLYASWQIRQRELWFAIH